MRRRIRTLSALLIAAASLVLVAGQLPASAAGINQGVIPSAVPGNTPQIADGTDYKVLDMAQVGNRIVVVGRFAQVQNPSSSGAPTGPLINRVNIFAFDPTNGQVDTAFAPVVNDVVDAVEAGPNNTLYIVGKFSTVNGAGMRRVAALNLSDGSLVPGFNPNARASVPNAEVQDVKLLGNRLFIAGSFTKIGQTNRGGLASLNATTGADDGYMTLDVSGHHNYGVVTGAVQGAVGVVNIDINPAGNRMIAIGNFKNVEGQLRDQVASITLGSTSATLDNWAAPGYQVPCKFKAFDSWVRAVAWSPDGSYFVIDGTGAYSANQLCDTAARFNASDTGLNVQPYWTAYSGGDSFFSVAITDTAVYVGGHQRWMNNPLAGDRAGAGAVPRPGLAALDPLNGVPLTWNPGRNPRGFGATAILPTSTGLYVGSDTNYIGNFKYTRKKLASFPLAGGTAPATQVTGSLPGTFYLAGNTANGGANGVEKRTSDGTSGGTSTDTAAATGGTTWSNARGAFMVGNQLFYGIKDSSGTFEMARRTFSAGTFGAEEILSTPYKDPTWNGVSTGSGTSTYDGVFPNFYGTELGTVTGMFYWNGRMYYTKTGSSSLFYRYFSVDRGIVGPTAFTVPGTSAFGSAGGMFLNGTDLYVVNRTNGNLTRLNFTNGVVSGTATVVDSAHNWKGNALWFDSSGAVPPPVNHNPVAQISSASCSGLNCSFTSGSSDPDGDPLTYSWTFGDGGTSTLASPNHAYSTGGTYSVQLTVSDGRGGTDSTSTSVSPSSTTTTGNVAFRAAAQNSTPAGGTSISLTVPAAVQAGDALVLVVSNNGGSALSTAGVTATPPAGYTQVGIADSLVGAAGSNVAMRTQVFQKVASAGDAGSNLTVTLSKGAKANVQLIAYSGAVGANPVRVANGVGQAGAASHTTPTVTATAGDWVLSVWSDKVGAVSSWTAPSGESTRSTISSTGLSGEIASLAGDPGSPVATTGPVTGLTATPTAADSKAVVFSVVIAGS